MANFGDVEPVQYTRWLGLVDVDDNTNLPMGCAALARNVRFNLTEVQTRWGIQTAIQGLNKSPITGLLGTAYTPQSAAQSYFQAILFFDYTGALQIENPTGSGTSSQIVSGLLSLPAQSHMIGTQAYNRAFMSFSNLLTPNSYPAVYDLFSQNLYPYGMKPLGFGWVANLPVLIGECTTPSQIQNGSTISVGNGHLYRCIQAGTTGASQPIWPTNEGGTIADGTAVWQERTPVLANRLPSPNVPQLAHSPGSGSFPAGRDVYVVITFTNTVGETIASNPAKFTNTSANDRINVTIPALASLSGWMQTLPGNFIPNGVNVYEADVATGANQPPGSAYQQVSGSPFALGTTANINSSASSGITPPSQNTARITGGMLPIPVVAPVITRSSGTGSFPAGRDVYVIQTYTNNAGETTPGPASSIINTQLNDAVIVTIAGLNSFNITSIKIYECDVPTGTTFPGSEFPPFSQFGLVGSYQPGNTPSITASSTGVPPPITNTTGTIGNIVADTLTGGTDGTQGYRYAVIAYQNVFATVSGIANGAVIKYIVDENGYELSVFNLPVGPSYIQNVIVGFTVADGTPAGPFGYVPSTIVSNNVTQTATVVANGTTSATFNFTDTYLNGLLANAETNITDRFRVIQPQQCVDIYYSPETNRIYQSGVPGFYSTHWVSLAGDVESYYGDTGNVNVASDDGERAWCVREFRNVPYSLRERSGFELSPTTGDPSTWTPRRRWTKVGPCGPRAVDVCGEFLIFIHYSGIYKYDGATPELVSKEIPRWWNTINWQAAQVIWCAIDVDNHEIHMGFPVGGSTVPNVKLTLNYEEGWNNPLLFSRYSGKEITIEQCRKYSVDDIAGFVAARIYRTVPNVPIPVEGEVNTDNLISQQTVSQFLIASSSPDGTVQAVTPGVFNDNGAGIDSQYEPVSIQHLMALSKLHGITLNARGNGQMQTWFIPGAKKVTDWKPGMKDFIRKFRPVDLEPNPLKGITRQGRGTNERWRPHFDNGAIPDAWFAIKEANVYSSVIAPGRESSEN